METLSPPQAFEALDLKLTGKQTFEIPPLGKKEFFARKDDLAEQLALLAATYGFHRVYVEKITNELVQNAFNYGEQGEDAPKHHPVVIEWDFEAGKLVVENRGGKLFDPAYFANRTDDQRMDDHLAGIEKGRGGLGYEYLTSFARNFTSTWCLESGDRIRAEVAGIFDYDAEKGKPQPVGASLVACRIAQNGEVERFELKAYDQARRAGGVRGPLCPVDPDLERIHSYRVAVSLREHGYELEEMTPKMELQRAEYARRALQSSDTPASS